MGDGPTYSTLQRALEIRVASAEQWLPSQQDAYHNLNLGKQPTLVLQTSLLDLKVDGSLMALVMTQLLLEPYPVDLFLVYAAFFNGPECLDLILSPYREYKPLHLQAMIRDQPTRIRIAMLITHTCDETFTTEEVASHPLLSQVVLSDVIWFPITSFCSPHTPEEHQALVCLLLSELLIGHATPWDLRQFKSFSTGLWLGICEVNNIVKVCEAVGSGHILRLTTALL